jgi:hypothetical protein
VDNDVAHGSIECLGQAKWMNCVSLNHVSVLVIFV